MKQYEVNYTDRTTGATSPLDVITAPNDYTAADYIRDCEKHADFEYVEMLHAGDVTIIEIVNKGR